nr:endomucin isoform X1 [Pogona vitticeps]
MSAGLRKIMTMKLFGPALISLALFSSCCADEHLPTSRPNNSSTTTEPPKHLTLSETVDTRTNATTPSSNLTSLSTSNSTTGEKITTSPVQCSVTSTPNSTLTAAPGKKNETTATPGFLNSTTNPLQEESSKSEPISTNTAEGKDDSSYRGIILPVIIALIVISLVVFLLMAMYKICLKTTPERQDNGTEQAPLDKENVKLISVKTTSPEAGMSNFLTLSSYDLPLDMSLPLEAFKPMRAVFSRED